MARFTVGTRVIDLLGIQQVAGTPTALSELFKNAHDAYADNVQVDFFRALGLVVLRDDGVGMTRQEFQSRWLVAATDSKRNDGFTDLPPHDTGKPKRPVMGEKGIGRLAIALLGKQVLVLTRSKGAGPSGPVTACFINWGVFSLPGLSLDDIDVTLKEFPAGTVPGASDVTAMVESSAEGLEKLRGKTDAARLQAVIDTVRGFAVDPTGMSGEPHDGLGLRNGYGTHFYIKPSSPDLAQDIGESEKADRATPIQKVLVGFNNTMVPGAPAPVMRTSFKDRRGEGQVFDLIEDKVFFTPDEFSKADHHIQGAFDAYGQFLGTVQVYGGEKREFQVHWPRGNGRPVPCGPFKLNLAYVQGNRVESIVKGDDFDNINKKLDSFGGLYIYRNGMRILPYGDTDNDFLQFENRRLKGAAYYFFSYRRMFGAIDITRENNSGLVEKAGREGFQENDAFRQFKRILEHFFVQVAARFFRKDGTEAEEFFVREAELKRQHDAAERRNKLVAPQRLKLAAALGKFHEGIASGAQRRQTDEILARTLATLSGERPLTATAIRKIGREARESIRSIESGTRVTRPRGVGLTRELTHAWARYEVERKRLVDETFGPAYRKLDEAVHEAAGRSDVVIDLREDTAERLNDRRSWAEKEIKVRAQKVQSDVGKATKKVSEIASEALKDFNARATATLVQFEQLDFASMSADEFSGAREKLEGDLEASATDYTRRLDQLAEQVSHLGTLESSVDDTLEALETELEDRREREMESLRLAQMGKAIGIVHHEFQAVTKTVSSGIRRLARWAERHPKLDDIYRQINEGYSHLDSYLGLFAPLNRSLNQIKRVIDGLEISQYVNQLLGERMRRHGIKFVVTPAFEQATVEEYASTVFPSFVNLADNAIFWMDHGAETTVQEPGGRGSSRPKVLTLDHDGDAFVVSDTGPGILPADEGAIFEAGFSRKPGGSGLGLHITKSLLEKSGFALTVDPYDRDRGATFRIKPPSTDPSKVQ